MAWPDQPQISFWALTAPSPGSSLVEPKGSPEGSPSSMPKESIDISSGEWPDKPSREWADSSRESSLDTLFLLSASLTNPLTGDQGVDRSGPGRHRPSSRKWARLSRPAIRAFWTRNLALVYMLLAALFGTGMNVGVRILEHEGDGMHPLQILFVRMAITTALSMAYMAWKRTPDFPLGRRDVRWLLVFRSLGGFLGVLGMWYSLEYLPVADATVLTYLIPGLACWVCSYVLGDAFTRVHLAGTLVSMIGLVFIVGPASLLGSGHKAEVLAVAAANNTGLSMEALSSNATILAAGAGDQPTATQRLLAVGAAMIGVAGGVLAIVMLRCIGRRAHPLIATNYLAVACTVVSFMWLSAVPSIGFMVPETLRAWGLLLFLGLCGFIMQCCSAAGLQYEKGSRATNMTYTGMLFALVGDRFIFNITPNATSMVGFVLILGAAIVMALQKGEEPRKEEGTAGEDEESGRVYTVGGEGDGDESVALTVVQKQ